MHWKRKEEPGRAMRIVFALSLSIAVILMGLPTGSHIALAEEETPASAEPAAPESQPADEADAPESVDGRVTTYDDSRLDFGVWYVQNYTGLSDLPLTQADALGLRTELRSSGYSTPTWYSRFNRGNAAAYADHWERWQAFGSEYNYIDEVDLAYFAGHGSSTRFYFGDGYNWFDNLVRDKTVHYNDVYRSWGNEDLDWVGLAACQVLDDPNLGNWANSMDGLRLIMGFKTVMSDVAFGKWFGEYIRRGYTLPQAWFKAVDVTQNRSKIARVVAQESWMYNDRYYNHASQDYRDNTYWYWTKRATRALGRSDVDDGRRFVNAKTTTEMPIYQVQPLSLDEANNRWGALGSATGVTTTNFSVATHLSARAGLDGEVSAGLRFSADNKLQLDEGSGLFGYANTDQLYIVAGEPLSRTGQAMVSLSATDAITMAAQFLKGAGLLPGDAHLAGVQPDVLAEAAAPTGQRSNSGIGQVLSEQTTANHVVYSRVLTHTTQATERTPAETVEFSVLGPGAKLLVTVADAVPAGLSAAAAVQEAVLGANGGYRAVQTPVNRETGAPLTVQVLPYETVAKLLDLNQQGHAELEARYALAYQGIPDIESRTIQTYTLAYWEGSMAFNQAQLIPVYAFTVRNVVEGGGINITEAEFPVNALYYPPIAKVDSVVAKGTTTSPNPVAPGAVLTLSAVDATSTLADIGYDAALNFSPGSGDYIYNWYQGEISAENLIGTGRVVDYTAAIPVGEDLMDGVVRPVSIILEVRDISPQSDRQVSTAVHELGVAAPVYLP
ncbi:MAG: DUF6345 domain-containing protein, partial [Caldilineaceae bacterium]